MAATGLMSEARSLPGSDARPAADPLLEVQGLVVEFATEDGVVRAVDGVSLAIEPGRTLALVGESGCGKSVSSFAILRLLPGSARVLAGSVLLRDAGGPARDLLTLDRKALRRLRGNDVAIIFQEPMSSLNPVQRVGDQIAEAIRMHRPVGRREALEAAARMLERVGIPEPDKRLRSFPHELSGGMRQRVMIAMALICGPSLLIADEPTTALDVTIQAQILDLLRELQASMGMAMLFITHDLGVVAEIAHDVAVMYAGQIVEQGSVVAVLKAPRHPYTRGLLASVPRTDRPRSQQRRMAAIPGIVPDLAHLPPGCRFQPRCAMAEPGVCDVGQPPLEVGSDGHAVRCWRWRELAAVTDA